MRRMATILSVLAMALTAAAQQTRVWHGNVAAVADWSDMSFSLFGQQMTIGYTTFETAEIDSITFHAAAREEQEVNVVFQGNTAQVFIPLEYASDVTATVDGAHVSITNNNVTEEYRFCVSGATTNGSLTYNGTFKTTIALDNASITNPAGPAIDIQSGKRTELELKGNNTLVDGAGEQKACLYCKGHLEISGGGNLNVTGNQKHAISTKEYLQLKRSCGTINIVKAVGDAIHASQYFHMNGGTLNIDANTAGDGVDVETTKDETDENNGQIIVKGGALNITITGQDNKAMKCDNLITISGGTFNIAAKGNGSRGIQTDGNMVVGEEDGTTSITVSAEGARCTAPECADDPHRCMGIKVDGNLTVNAGTIKVTNTGSKSRGIKCGTYTKNGGTVEATIVN